MIVFLTTSNHRYTHGSVKRAVPFVKVKSYEAAFRARTMPSATYIFTDFDRLNSWDQELAADLFRVLRRAGCRVLNDPARALQRYALLNRLHRLEINQFRAWRPDEGVLPSSYPVFLRTQAAHRGVLSGLLNTENEASAALDQALEDGFPLANLMFVEYCAEPTKEGVYWKHSVYKIGNALLAGPSVLDQSWLAKMGQKGLATDDQLHFEQQLVLKGVFADKLLPAFDAAQIDYGRADFALVNNRLAVYEINTNPYISLSTKHRTPIRVKTLEIIRKGYLEALEQLDMTSASSRPVMVRSDRFVPAFRRRFKFRLGTP